jgi:hypothetical protein
VTITPTKRNSVTPGSSRAATEAGNVARFKPKTKVETFFRASPCWSCLSEKHAEKQWAVMVAIATSIRLLSSWSPCRIKAKANQNRANTVRLMKKNTHGKNIRKFKRGAQPRYSLEDIIACIWSVRGDLLLGKHAR